MHEAAETSRNPWAKVEDIIRAARMANCLHPDGHRFGLFPPSLERFGELRRHVTDLLEVSFFPQGRFDTSFNRVAEVSWAAVLLSDQGGAIRIHEDASFEEGSQPESRNEGDGWAGFMGHPFSWEGCPFWHVRKLAVCLIA